MRMGVSLITWGASARYPKKVKKLSEKDAVFHLGAKYHINMLYAVTQTNDNYVAHDIPGGIPRDNINALRVFAEGLISLMNNYDEHPEKLNKEYVDMIYKTSMQNRNKGMRYIWRIARAKTKGTSTPIPSSVGEP
jgi:hypothetical protein